MITLSYIHFWNDPNNDSYFTEFIEENIGPVKIVENNENPDILISSVNGDIHAANINNVRILKAKCKIFFYGENLNRFPNYNDELLYEIFDLIVGFRKTNLSKKLIRFPLWLIYYPYYNYNDNDNILTHIQNKYDENIKKQKNFFATVIARHDRGRQRTKIWDEVSKYGDIKSGSRWRSNIKRIGGKLQDKIDFISNGIYNICPENSVYEEYFTEKIFQAFEGGTIPLYWAVGLPEPDIINKNKYCFCNIDNKEELEKSIHNVCTNPNQYIEGELFTKDAGEHVKLFYSTLLENILSYIK